MKYLQRQLITAKHTLKSGLESQAEDQKTLALHKRELLDARHLRKQAKTATLKAELTEIIDNIKGNIDAVREDLLNWDDEIAHRHQEVVDIENAIKGKE